MFEKWYFGGIALVLAVYITGQAVIDISDRSAKRDIIVACYNAHQPNCEKLWGTNNDG